MNFYDLKAKDMQGQEIRLDRYQGKVIVVVNTASKCGLTPQFENLEKLYQTYQDKGLVILGFPCNQFGNQDPGSKEEILSFCQLNYGVTFPMFDKIDVNGENTHPVFAFLKQHTTSFAGKSIKWNFTKFLIDKNGTPIKRYAPQIDPLRMEQDIIRLLG